MRQKYKIHQKLCHAALPVQVNLLGPASNLAVPRTSAPTTTEIEQIRRKVGGAYQEGGHIVLPEGSQQCLEDIQDVAPVRAQLSRVGPTCKRQPGMLIQDFACNCQAGRRSSVCYFTRHCHKKGVVTLAQRDLYISPSCHARLCMAMLLMVTHMQCQHFASGA